MLGIIRIKKIQINQKGLSLVETIIYILIVSLVVGTILSILVQLVQLKTQADSMSIISQEVTNVFDKMINDIHNCDSFSVVNNSTLRVVKDGSTIEYSLSNAKVHVLEGGGDYYLTSNLVSVSQLSFVDWTSVNSDNLIHIELTLTRGKLSENFRTSVQKR
jgi:hypothetical protein